MSQEILKKLFSASGWNGFDINGDSLPLESPKAFAERVINEFSGLHVGSVAAGIDLPASDVLFYTNIRPEVSVVVKPWSATTGELWAIATAHHQHMIIFTGANGRFYAFTDPDEQLYLLGSTFCEAMERLLLGRNYGQPISKS